jgi:hypothetical protein
MKLLSDWETFYVIIGSAAGALIGLQFVVVTLIAERPPRNASVAGAAFSTPSVVHFAVVLLLSAVASIPWSTLVAIAVIWAAVGLSGIAYSFLIARRMRTQTVYRPVFEDWLFHVLLPFAAYGALAISGFIEFSNTRPGPFIVGAATLVLLFVGIHNAWDTVTYHVFTKRANSRTNGKS